MSCECKVTGAFSQSVACLFIFLTLVFHKQSCYILMKSDSPFCMVIFFVLFEKSLPGPSSIGHLCSLPAALCLVLAFRSVIQFKVMYVKVSSRSWGSRAPTCQPCNCCRVSEGAAFSLWTRSCAESQLTTCVPDPWDAVLTRRMRLPFCWTTWSVSCRCRQWNLSSQT